MPLSYRCLSDQPNWAGNDPAGCQPRGQGQLWGTEPKPCPVPAVPWAGGGDEWPNPFVHHHRLCPRVKELIPGLITPKFSGR